MILLFPEALTLVHYPFLPSYPDPAPTSEVATRIAAYYNLLPRNLKDVLLLGWERWPNDDQQYRMGRWNVGKSIEWVCWSWVAQGHSCWRRMTTYGLRLYSGFWSHYLRQRCRCWISVEPWVRMLNLNGMRVHTAISSRIPFAPTWTIINKHRLFLALTAI